MARTSDLDRLYALPLAEFTAARNELSKVLRAAGDRERADRVKALAKPSVAAWAVNQVFHHERTAFDRLLAAAAEQRRALTRRGAMSPAASERKRAALAELLRAAERRLEQVGNRWTPALRQRVTRTLEALAAQGPRGSYRPGRLTVDLQPSGFDALLDASIARGARKPARKAVRKPQANSRRPTPAGAKRLQAARAKVQSIKKELATARRKRSALSRKHAGLERRASEAGKRARAAERRADQSRRRAAELELDARRVGKELGERARAVARLEARLETEARKLEDLG